MLPLLDLKKHHQPLMAELENEFVTVVEQAAFIMGKAVVSFEEEFQSLFQIKHALSCNSGTDALVMALRALGVGPGDEVITTPFTFFASAESISAVGAKPVFVEVDKDTFNLDVSKVEAAITKKTKAILPVHIFGQPVEMEPLLKLAKKYNLAVVEDACQAIGSSYRFADGTDHLVGTMGDAAAFSFFPTKNLGACGDGGMVTTIRSDVAKIIKALRVHGSGEAGRQAYEALYGEHLAATYTTASDSTVYDPSKYYNYLIGYNSRLDALQAAILRVKLPHLAQWNERRRTLAQRYIRLLKEANLWGEERLLAQAVPEHVTSVWHLFVVRCEERAALASFLQERGIATGIYYPVPLHLQKVYQNGPYALGYREGDLPVSEWLSQRTMALPLYPELAEEEQEQVVAAIVHFYQGR